MNIGLEGMWEQAAVASFLYRTDIFQERLRKATKKSVTLINLWVLTSGLTNILNTTATSFGLYVIVPSTVAVAPLFVSLPHRPLRFPLTSASTDLISNNVSAFRFSFIYIL